MFLENWVVVYVFNVITVAIGLWMVMEVFCRLYKIIRKKILARYTCKHVWALFLKLMHIVCLKNCLLEAVKHKKGKLVKFVNKETLRYVTLSNSRMINHIYLIDWKYWREISVSLKKKKINNYYAILNRKVLRYI